jgi:hypothetical protein
MQQIEDKTNELVNYLNGKLVNYRVDRGLTAFNDHTNHGIGYKDKARGYGQITSVDLSSGTIQKIDVGAPGIPIIWTAEITFSIRYSANTHGERWAYPGGAIVDNIWGSINSAGTIKANLKIKPQSNGLLTFEINVDPDSNDRPGNFVKEYIAPLFKDVIDNTLEQFTNLQID